MSSEYFIDKNGNYDNFDDKRSRSEVFPDYAFHELLDDELSDISINEALSEDSLVEHLRDDRIYLINKDFYHTFKNIDPEIAHKVDAGPDNRGIAGDIDVGYIDISSGKIDKVELKSPGRIPPVEKREKSEKTFNAIKDGEKQNRYLKRLLDNLEANTGFEVPYSSRVQAWRDRVDNGVENINKIPTYSREGGYVCTPEAKQAAETSQMIQHLDDGLFKGLLFGGGEDILENMGYK